MKHHEREFFISTIRSSKVYIQTDKINLIIKPLTLDQSFEASLVYNQSYNQATIDGLMSEDEINVWMSENDLWTEEHELKIHTIKKDLERLKLEIYNNRKNKVKRENIRLYIRTAENYLSSYLKEKNIFYQNTREGYALSEKVSWIIKNTTYKNNKLYDFKELSLSYVVDEWQNSILSESIIRELAREEPWKSLWSIRENCGTKLFNIKDDEELIQNQKHLIVWSQIYDNIQESVDCPPSEVINDDDILDGWFISQSKKREKERLQQEFESKHNSKIKNANEVFVMADSNDKETLESINALNDEEANFIKKQRSEIIMKKGLAYQHDFADEKVRLQAQALEGQRRHFKGG